VSSSIPPSALAREYAEAALSCQAIDRARRLAIWIGDGRELTASGVLRPVVAAQACEALGIELPSPKLRSAGDVPELMHDWEMARTAGFIEIGSKRANAAAGLLELGPESAERVLGCWLNAAMAQFGFPVEPPCPGCLTVLHELSLSDGPVSLAELSNAVRAAEGGQQELDTATQTGLVPGIDPGQVSAPTPLWECPYCGEVHPDDPAQEHAEDAVGSLAEFGAAITGPGAAKGGTVRLTPLGRLLADSLLGALTPAPEADTADLIMTVGMMPPKIALHLSAPWLAARSAAGAVRELLRYAEYADPDQRMKALAIARNLGQGAAPRPFPPRRRPGFGAYARAWLSERDEPFVADPADEAWLLVESMSLAMNALPTGLAPLAFAAALQQESPQDLARALQDIGRSGHQDAERILAALSGFSGAVGAFGGVEEDEDEDEDEDDHDEDVIYQLKITLKDVSKPPVWRRVLVPAGVSLGLLHEVVLRAMGWDGGHLHAFGHGGSNYGPSDLEFELDNEDEDEDEVWLDDLLAEPGDKLRYTYDFGDDWVHEIRLEKVLPAGTATAPLTCLAGKGACPPEDCGGAWRYAALKQSLADPADDEHKEMLGWLGLDKGSDFDPAAFSVERVNARLLDLLDLLPEG
jgi:hypothetical protein